MITVYPKIDVRRLTPEAIEIDQVDDQRISHRIIVAQDNVRLLVEVLQNVAGVDEGTSDIVVKNSGTGYVEGMVPFRISDIALEPEALAHYQEGSYQIKGGRHER